MIDANVLIAIAAKESGTHREAEVTFKKYSQNGWTFFAPDVLVAEVLFALCQKLNAGLITQAEYDSAIQTFKEYLTIISLPADDGMLATRAVEIRKTYGCSLSSDSLYIALAESLANNNSVEIFTLDAGMTNQAAKNAPSVVVRSI